MVVSRVGVARQLWASCVHSRMCQGGSGTAPILVPARGWISLPRGSFPKADLGEAVRGRLVEVADFGARYVHRQTGLLAVGSSRGKTRRDVCLRECKSQELASACSRPCSMASSLSQLLPCPLGASSHHPRAWSWQKGWDSDGESLTLLSHDKGLDSCLNTPHREAVLLDRLNYI